MRAFLVPLLLVTGACGQSEPDVAPPEAVEGASSSYAGAGRDRMCLISGRPDGGLITFAATGDANCSLRFTTSYKSGSTSTGTLAAANDPSCTIPFTRATGGKFALGAPSAACAYYCGPGASLEGKTFARMDSPEPVTDIAGDPLC
jgi:hypothetical protein